MCMTKEVFVTAIIHANIPIRMQKYGRPSGGWPNNKTQQDRRMWQGNRAGLVATGKQIYN